MGGNYAQSWVGDFLDGWLRGNDGNGVILALYRGFPARFGTAKSGGQPVILQLRGRKRAPMAMLA
jgi:hypothetical protein